MSALMNYKKLLDEKSKLASNSGFSQGKSNDKTKERIKFLSFFNPTKILNMKDEVVVRVLPNKEGFYHEYIKHMMKLGDGVFKQFVCLHSKNKNGAEYGDCPLCAFLEDNGRELSKDSYYKLMAKNAYLMFVYNPDANEIQKYETNDFGIVDITSALVKLIDDNDDNFDPDVEGFGLVFKKDDKGYAKVVQAILPSIEVENILKKVGVDEIKDFYEEIMPFNLNYTMKQINNTYSQIIKSFAPTFDYEPYLIDTGGGNDNLLSEEDEFKPEMFETKTKKSKVSKTVVEPDSEEDEDTVEEDTEKSSDDSQISDIRDFLKNKKKA